MNRIDESITGALRDRADGGVHVEELLTGARRRGQRRRLVRRTFAGAGVGAMALAVIGAVAVLPLGAKTDGSPGLDGAADRPSAAAPVKSPAGRPPVAAGAPVLAKGGIPGKDGLFHLDYEGSPATSGFWRSGPGWELLDTSTPAVPPAQFGVNYTAAIADSAANLDKALAATGGELTPNPTSTPLTVGDQPATFVWSGMSPADGARWGYLRWQPVAGTWALVFSSFAADPGTNGDTDRAQLLGFTKSVRFDRVYRCAVNFKITWAPSNARVTTCEFAGGGQPTARVGLTAGAAAFSVTLGPGAATAAKPVHPNTDYAGTPLEYTDAGRVRRVVGDFVVTLDQGTVLLGQQDALRLAAGVQPIAAPDPADWPRDPMH